MRIIICEMCGKEVSEAYMSIEGADWCSAACYQESLPDPPESASEQEREG